MSKKVDFTDEQIDAIDFSINKPAVVTAAAGSGKTTLLVERIIRLISDVDNPLDASSLAIMTFTVNATQSLREKLNKALQEKIDELSENNSPKSVAERNYLSEQIINLRSASISTINAFCLGIIRENFQQFDLPINFTIADDTKRTSMQLAAEQLVKQDFYDENSENGFSAEKRDTLFYMFNFEDDQKLFESVAKTADMLSSYGNAGEWLDKSVDAHSSIDALEKEYLDVYIELIDRQFSKIQSSIDTITNSVSEYQLLDASKEAKKKSKNFKEVFDEISNSRDFDQMRFSILEKDYANFKANPSMSTLETLIDNAAKYPENPQKLSQKDRQLQPRKDFNKATKIFSNAYSKIIDLTFSKSEEELSLSEQSIAAQAFAELVKKYISYYSEIKRSQGCIDFSDCELLLLEKLQKDDDFRKQLSQRFSCIIVDEFQDSNDVQAEIFRLLGNGNLFYVGDVKQAIYAFRGGNPMIMAKLCNGADGFSPLPLNMNFRSRKQIINVVNAAFCGLMTEEYGGVDYEHGNQLEYGAKFQPLSNAEEAKYNAELYELVIKGSDEEKAIKSARFTARLIKKIVDDDNFFITKKDKDDNEIRVRPTYSDFIILMRKNKNIKHYRNALAELDIPAISSKSRNFLASEEISLIISLLKVIDNPLRDEDTINVLMSPLYDFSAEEIAELKLGVLGYNVDELSDDDINKISQHTKKGSLYKCLKFCTQQTGERFSPVENDSLKNAEQAEEDLSKRGISRVISQKAEAYLRDLESFRYFMSNNSTDNLIGKIYEDTDVFAVVSAYDDSRQRISNLRRFETIATDFVAREYGMLSDFLRFIDKSIQDTSDIEEANTPENAENSVRIMTFHASKGLEAPICILAELDEKLNGSDAKGPFLKNHDYGFSIDYVDRKNRFRFKTFSGIALRNVNKKNPIGEELRLLYVAMTRAQEKLIMIEPNTEKNISEITTKDFDPDEIFEGTKPFRWVSSALMRWISVDERKEGRKTIKSYSFGDLPLNFNKVTDEMLNNFVNGVTTEPCVEINDNQNDEENVVEDEELVDEDELVVEDEELVDEDEEELFSEDARELAELISKPYHNLDETHRQAKFSVTELAHKNKQIPFTLTKPAFAVSGKMIGADLGNAYHHCMEHISFDVVRNSPENELIDNISNELCRLCDEGKITEDEFNCIKAERIAGFFTSNLGKRMLNSENIMREFPFYAEIEGSQIDEKLSGKIGVQGRIDAFFIENDEIVVIDYKTDYDIKAELDAYEMQVKIYAGVLPMLLGKSVSQTCLYSFSEGKEISL